MDQAEESVIHVCQLTTVLEANQGMGIVPKPVPAPVWGHPTIRNAKTCWEWPTFKVDSEISFSENNNFWISYLYTDGSLTHWCPTKLVLHCYGLKQEREGMVRMANVQVAFRDKLLRKQETSESHTCNCTKIAQSLNDALPSRGFTKMQPLSTTTVPPVKTKGESSALE